MSEIGSEIDIKIGDHGCTVRIDKNTTRDISHEDFVELYSSVLGKDIKREEETLLLPSGTMLLSRSSTTLLLTCYYPSSKRNMKMEHTTSSGNKKINEFELLTPNIILSHKLTQDKSNKDWILDQVSPKYFCTDLSPSKIPKIWIAGASAKDRIWINPFTNTYSDGRMCTGQNTMQRRFPGGNLRGLDWHYAYMWEAPFNTDLGLYGIQNKFSVTEWYNMLVKCAKENLPFPYEHIHGYTNP